MSNANDFVIETGVLKKYVGPGADVIIPDSVKTIGDDAFDNCENPTIHALAGSYAETYPTEHNIPFVAE